MNENKTKKVRVPRDSDFIGNKNISDIAYMMLFLEAAYDPKNPTFRKLSIKDVNYSRLTEGVDISRQTFAKYVKKLIEVGRITEENGFYILPVPQDNKYYDIETETIEELIAFAKNHSIKIYVYLLGWHRYCLKNGDLFNFSLDNLCKTIGLTEQQSRNHRTIKYILSMLERLELIKVSDTPCIKVIMNNKTTYHYQLLDASDALPPKKK